MLGRYDEATVFYQRYGDASKGNADDFATAGAKEISSAATCTDTPLVADLSTATMCEKYIKMIKVCVLIFYILQQQHQ